MILPTASVGPTADGGLVYAGSRFDKIGFDVGCEMIASFEPNHRFKEMDPLSASTSKSDISDYLPGSVRDISLGDMTGIEFRTQGGIGESIFREY